MRRRCPLLEGRITAIDCEQLAVLPAVSFAVQMIVVIPMG
jgi:hypothetical protein